MPARLRDIDRLDPGQPTLGEHFELLAGSGSGRSRPLLAHLRKTESGEALEIGAEQPSSLTRAQKLRLSALPGVGDDSWCAFGLPLNKVKSLCGTPKKGRHLAAGSAACSPDNGSWR